MHTIDWILSYSVVTYYFYFAAKMTATRYKLRHAPIHRLLLCVESTIPRMTRGSYAMSSQFEVCFLERVNGTVLLIYFDKC